MKNISWFDKSRKAFDTTCETIKITESNNELKLYRYINGEEKNYTNVMSTEELINDRNREGYFISAVGLEENHKTYYLTNLTILSD